MSELIPSKEAVAFHEAGHALVALATPIRDFVVLAEIREDQHQWRGQFIIDGRKATAAKIDQAADFAKALGGPLAQIHYFPETIADNVMKLITSQGGLLAAVKHIRVNKMKDYNVHWVDDLEYWLQFVHYHPNSVARSQVYLDVESRVNDFIRLPIVEASLRSFSAKLVKSIRLERDALLAHEMEGIPQITLPQRLPMPSLYNSNHPGLPSKAS